jgi:uncharacterized membrane protein
MESEQKYKLFYSLLILFCLIGLGTMIYLPLELSNIVPNSCNINSFLSCGTVANSGYSHYFGVPVYAYGWVFFSLMLVLSLLDYFMKDRPMKRFLVYFLLVFGVSGAIAASYLIYTELAKIGAICPMCTIAQICIFSIAGLSLYLFAKNYKQTFTS